MTRPKDPEPVAAQTAVLNLSTPEATSSLAARLAPRLRPGDVLLLEGGIGAGKTHFARALIQSRLAAAGLFEDVPSPTFTLVQTYGDGATEIWHADLYRLGDPAEIWELGLDEAMQTGICLIEWPDRLGAATPVDALHLHFAPGTGDDERQLALQARGPRGRELLAILAPPGGRG